MNTIDSGKNELFVTYKFYTKKGDRLALFGQEWDGELKIVAIRCSRRDMFSKYSAKWAYSQWACGTKTKYHPTELSVNILNGETPRHAFNRWCEDNYYRKQTVIVPYIADVISNQRELKIIDSTARRFKKLYL